MREGSERKEHNKYTPPGKRQKDGEKSSRKYRVGIARDSVQMCKV